jgi:hypothetical protein
VVTGGRAPRRALRARSLLRRLEAICDVVVADRAGGGEAGEGVEGGLGAGIVRALGRIRPDGPAARLVADGARAGGEEPGTDLDDRHALALLAEASRRPVALLVEEAHLVDPRSWALLERLLSAVDTVPLLLVLTMPTLSALRRCVASSAGSRSRCGRRPGKEIPMTITPIRPTGRPAPATDVVLEVVNTTEPDEVVHFDEEGRSALFGRDDDMCEIVIWSAINGRELSRVAGRIWRMDGRLWVQNLSRHHELVVVGGGVEVLPPCEPGSGAGPGCSLPWGSSVVLGPGGCELHVTQSRVDDGSFGVADQQTDGLPPIPEGLLSVALALCEPLLRGATAPATYRQVSERAGLGSYKRARLLVTDLCEPYLPLVRPARVADVAARPVGRISGGVWRFAAPVGAEDPSPVLRIPDYVLVAQLLVRRHLVRREMLGLLDVEVPGSPADVFALA